MTIYGARVSAHLSPQRVPGALAHARATAIGTAFGIRRHCWAVARHPEDMDDARKHWLTLPVNARGTTGDRSDGGSGGGANGGDAGVGGGSCSVCCGASPTTPSAVGAMAIGLHMLNAK